MNRLNFGARLVGVPFTQRILDAEKLKVNGEVDFTVKNLATHKFAVAAWAQGYRHNRNHTLVRGDIANTKLAEIQEYRDERLVILTNSRHSKVVRLFRAAAVTRIFSVSVKRLQFAISDNVR